jgi:hypothetical protein
MGGALSLRLACADAAVRAAIVFYGVAPPEEQLDALAAPVLAEAALLVVRQVRQVGHEDLAHLAGGAGDEGDADAVVDVAGHRGAVVDALVVGVGVDEEEAAIRHALSLDRDA